MDDRKQREKDFHDDAYHAGSREKLRKFYSVMQLLDIDFQQMISGCGGKRILEYGCGQGSYAYFFRKNGADVTGIDISEVAIEQAKEKAKTLQLGRMIFLVMDAENLQFENNSFDMICGRAILHHLDLNKAYSEIARVLDKNGHAVFIEPMGHNPILNWYRKRTPELRSPDEHPLLIHDIELASKFFNTVQVRFYYLFSFGTFVFRNWFIFKPLLRAVHTIDQFVFLIFPFLKKHAWYSIITLQDPKKYQ